LKKPRALHPHISILEKAMGMFKRISDILSANLNEMVDHWEEPDKMLRQAIREMELTIDDSKRSVAKAMANEKLVGKELLENQRQAREWNTRAETAVEAGDDALARKALSRKQEHDRLAAALLDQYTAAQEASVTLRRQLDAMHAKLADAKRRLGTLEARKKAADVRARVQMAHFDPKLNDDAFAKFDRLREKVEMAEAEADALRELSTSPGPTDEWPDAVKCQDADIDADLAELKMKLRK
jgi:phage shock protein A